MRDRIVKIIDGSRNTVATARVSEREGRCFGEIDLGPMPDALLQRFEEYERLVNGQMFALLDDIEDQIDSFSLKVVLESGHEVAIEDVQIYPRSGRVSFKAELPPIPPPDPGVGSGIGNPGPQPITERP